MKWRDKYKELYREHLKKTTPLFARDFPNTDPLIPKESTSNGLTQLIIRWLTWSGHYANRISTQGQAQVHKIPRWNVGSEQMQYSKTVKWIKGSTKRGTPDISAIIFGRSVWIEVKVGKDRLSEEQKEQGAAIQEAGGAWFVARDMQSFVNFYYQFLEDA